MSSDKPIELEQFIREQELENPLIELKEKDLPIQYEERVQRTTNSSDSHDILMNTLKSQEVNMRDELFAQAKFMISDDDALTLLSTLIYNLNNNGYLTDLDTPSIVALQLTDSDIDWGIQLLQQIAPLGTGARTLKECLLLQLNYGYPDDELAQHLVEHHLQLIADRKWNDIATLMKIPLAEVKRLCDLIRSLNPRPYTFISDNATSYLNP